MAGIGQYRTLSGGGSVTLRGSASGDVTVTHDQLVFMGGLAVTLAPAHAADGTVVIVQAYSDSQFVFTLANGTAGSITFDYTWTRSGKVLTYG